MQDHAPRALGALISGKAAAKLNKKLAQFRGAKANPTKMASFEGREKDEAGVRKRALIKSNAINNSMLQDRGGSWGTGGRAPPSKGGRAGAPAQPRRGAIDQAMMQGGGKFPAGGNVSASNPKTGNTRMKGTIANTGGQYGGGGQNTQ